MAKVTFAGIEDIRVLDGHDMRKAGVEGFHKTEFRKGEAVEVTDEMASALKNNPEIYGVFTFEESGPDPIEGTEPEAAAKKSSKSNASKAD